MGKLILNAGLCLIITSLASSSRLVCYYNSLAEQRPGDGRLTISDIDPNKCTHLIYAFAYINSTYQLGPRSTADIQKYQSFNALKARNPQLKTLVAVSGLGTRRFRFSTMLLHEQNRAKFIQSAIKLLRENGFDGLNIIWWGGAGRKTQYTQTFTLLCKELKEAFEAEGTAAKRLMVTASVSAVKAIIDASYEVEKIAKHLDFINVLTFDFHGTREPVTGHHSPLYAASSDTGDKRYANTDFAMRYWCNQGAPTQKLNMGLAAYGRTFTLSSASSSVGAPVSGPGQKGDYTNQNGFLAYYEICFHGEGLTTQMIADQGVPYATKDNLWVGFDSKESLDTKVSYLKQNNFGGAFVSSLDLDDFSGQFCKQGNYPFISHLHNLLVPGFPQPGSFICDGITDGHYPNPANPNCFFICARQIAHIQCCQKGLIYKKSCDCCDWPTTTSNTDGGCDVSTPCSGKVSGADCNPADPGSFFLCDGQNAHLMHCPGNLIFKQSCECCDNSDSSTNTIITTTTSTQTPTTTTTTTTTISNTNGGCDVSTPCSGKVSGADCNPADPGSFFLCDGQKAHLMHCPGNLIFKESCECCDNP